MLLMRSVHGKGILCVSCVPRCSSQIPFDRWVCFDGRGGGRGGGVVILPDIRVKSAGTRHVLLFLCVLGWIVQPVGAFIDTTFVLEAGDFYRYFDGVLAVVV